MRWMQRGFLIIIALAVVALSIMNDHQVDVHIPFREPQEIALYRLLFIVMASGVTVGLLSGLRYERRNYRALKKSYKHQEATLKSMQQEIQALRAEAQAMQDVRFLIQQEHAHNTTHKVGSL